MCDEFLDKEVLPHLNALDQQQEGLMPSLVDKAGELGLLGAAFPEKYNGLGKDFVTATLINALEADTPLQWRWLPTMESVPFQYYTLAPKHRKKNTYLNWQREK